MYNKFVELYKTNKYVKYGLWTLGALVVLSLFV